MEHLCNAIEADLVFLCRLHLTSKGGSNDKTYDELLEGHSTFVNRTMREKILDLIFI